jgi:para-aminobenzoate synthetase component 1
MELKYPLLKRTEIIERMNLLGSLGVKFLFIIDFEANSGYVIPETELDSNYLYIQFPDFQFPNQKNQSGNISKILWDIFPVDYEDYRSKLLFVQQEIRRGNSFLVNLTQPTKIETDLNLEEIFSISRAKYKLLLKDKFVVFSPETFVRIADETIASFPMKGTIDAKMPDALNLVLNNKKEIAEHATIVDLIRNDLSMVAENVRVERYRFVENIQTNKGELLQVSSCIKGNLAENYKQKLGDIIFKMLPAGSISGAPKPKTLDIIREAEGYDRGFYTGIFGWFDGEKLDSAVMIRFIEQQSENLVFKSGGGITSLSDAESEYNELIQKVYVPIS